MGFLTAAATAIGAGATAAGAGLSTLAASSTAGTLIQGGATAVSMLSSMNQGRQGKRDAATELIYSRAAAQIEAGETDLAASEAELEATQEFIVGEQRANAIRTELLRVLGGQTVAYAAAGVDPTSGTAARVQEATEKAASEDIALEKSNANIRRLQQLQRASTIRRQGATRAVQTTARDTATQQRGQNAERAGQLSAIAAGFDFASGAIKRK